MAVKKNQKIEGLAPKGTIPGMAGPGDFPPYEALKRSNTEGEVRQPGAGKVVDPHAGVNRKGSYKA
jgi:hypothetical protein